MEMLSKDWTYFDQNRNRSKSNFFPGNPSVFGQMAEVIRAPLWHLLNLDGNGTGGTSLTPLRWRGHSDM